MKTLLVCIPVYNEYEDIKRNIPVLASFLGTNMSQYDWNILICNNGSTDKTMEASQELAAKNPRVRVVDLGVKGRGFALKESWLKSDADILSFMDVDLSTNLNNFPDLINAVAEGYHVAIGSRLLPNSNTQRSLKREIISRGYNLLVKLMFRNKFSDAQCGFKAVSSEVKRIILPFVENRNWFFDTELLLLCERRGYKIKEIPVGWIEDMDSRVKILKTVYEDVAGLLRMRFSRTYKELKK